MTIRLTKIREKTKVLGGHKQHTKKTPLKKPVVRIPQEMSLY